MKLFSTYFILLLAAGLSFRANAQENINIVKLGGSLLTIMEEGQGSEAQLYGGGSAAFEHQISRKFTLGLGVSVNTRTNNVILLSDQLTLISFEPEGRWYPKSATNGFYLGFAPGISLLRYKNNAILSLNSKTLISLGLKPGYQFKLSQRLALQIGTGIGVYLPNDDIDPTLLLNLNLMLGYSF